MEALIAHFKLFSEGIHLPEENMYVSTETPKGELGVFMVTNDDFRPYRCKIRSPGYFHLQGLSEITRGLLLADLVTTIGSIDIVLGEIDR
jgi:NADH:ubiquinone oxidoreductase subunit D